MALSAPLKDLLPQRSPQRGLALALTCLYVCLVLIAYVTCVCLWVCFFFARPLLFEVMKQSWGNKKEKAREGKSLWQSI